MNVFDRAAQTNKQRRYSSQTSTYTCNMWFCIYNILRIRKKRHKLTVWRLYSTLGWGSYRLCGSAVCCSPVPAHRRDRSCLQNKNKNKLSRWAPSETPWQHTEKDLNPNDVPFKSAASRSTALTTLTCRKPTSLRFFRDPFRHCGDSKQHTGNTSVWKDLSKKTHLESTTNDAAIL